jgi:hypothetical protein
VIVSVDVNAGVDLGRWIAANLTLSGGSHYPSEFTVDQAVVLVQSDGFLLASPPGSDCRAFEYVDHRRRRTVPAADPVVEAAYAVGGSDALRGLRNPLLWRREWIAPWHKFLRTGDWWSLALPDLLWHVHNGYASAHLPRTRQTVVANIRDPRVLYAFDDRQLHLTCTPPDPLDNHRRRVAAISAAALLGGKVAGNLMPPPDDEDEALTALHVAHAAYGYRMWGKLL